MRKEKSVKAFRASVVRAERRSDQARRENRSPATRVKAAPPDTTLRRQVGRLRQALAIGCNTLHSGRCRAALSSQPTAMRPRHDQGTQRHNRSRIAAVPTLQPPRTHRLGVRNHNPQNRDPRPQSVARREQPSPDRRGILQPSSWQLGKLDYDRHADGADAGEATTAGAHRRQSPACRPPPCSSTHPSPHPLFHELTSIQQPPAAGSIGGHVDFAPAPTIVQRRR
jgi:hypothetical protein